METNVFVVLNQYRGGPGVPIGAAADIDAAYEIADRADIWPHDIAPKWFVDLDTGVHSRGLAGAWQEIVRVPLAGHAAKPIEVLAGKWGQAKEILDASIFDQIAEAARQLSIFQPLGPRDVRVGTGAAYEYLVSALDRTERRKVRGLPVPDVLSMASLIGMSVIVDPAIPPNEIRIGFTVWIIGTAVGPVGAGSMARIDESGFSAYRPGSITTERE